jgi:2,3-bisphosphoglycerate-independent phosphoglycerate mutase
MLNKETDQPHTAHTTNQVPLVYVCGDKPLASGGSLSDLAPSMLDILGVDKPSEMTGRSLIAPT